MTVVALLPFSTRVQVRWAPQEILALTFGTRTVSPVRRGLVDRVAEPSFGQRTSQHEDAKHADTLRRTQAER